MLENGWKMLGKWEMCNIIFDDFFFSQILSFKYGNSLSLGTLVRQKINKNKSEKTTCRGSSYS